MKSISFIIVLLTCALSTSCTDSIDKMFFCWLGQTVLSKPQEITLKEIHLDNGKLLGQKIVIEGNLDKVGKYSTHAILSDKSARMLVVLTGVVEAEKRLKQEQPTQLRVLGTVERGKKGLPYVSAIAISNSSDNT